MTKETDGPNLTKTTVNVTIMLILYAPYDITLAMFLVTLFQLLKSRCGCEQWNVAVEKYFMIGILLS